MHSPVSSKEALDLLGSLSGVVPFLAPAKAVINLIASAVEEVEDNKNQCYYLLQRCVNLCLHIHESIQEHQILDNSSAKFLSDFKHALSNVHLCIEHLSRKTPLQRFLQRHEISDSIRNAHECLDGCLELFHVRAATSLIFVAAEHEEARKRDHAQLDLTLEQLQKNDVNILESLELRGDQLMEAIRGLRDTLRRGIDDAVQRQFAASSLQTLLERQVSFEFSEVQSYDWAVSSLEILVEGQVLGAGAFGTVYAGRWNGTRVAVKQLTRGTPRQILVKEIDIWRRMQHPHVASFFRACIESHPPLLISELYSFGNVMVYLAEFPNANRVNMCHEIALGMVFLHSHKVVHGDLKPANVLIDDAHRARITDFGLSRIKSCLTTQTIVDTTDLAMPRTPGTKVFMAPERLLRGTNNFQTDVYAWAMSVYQIFSDEAPFQHLPEDYIRVAIVEQHLRPDRPDGTEAVERGLTDEMWSLLERCWANDRHKRASFVEICDILAIWTNYSATLRQSLVLGDEFFPSQSLAADLPLKASISIKPDVYLDIGPPTQIPGTNFLVASDDFQLESTPGFSSMKEPSGSAESDSPESSSPPEDVFDLYRIYTSFTKELDGLESPTLDLSFTATEVVTPVELTPTSPETASTSPLESIPEVDAARANAVAKKRKSGTWTRYSGIFSKTKSSPKKTSASSLEPLEPKAPVDDTPKAANGDAPGDRPESAPENHLRPARPRDAAKRKSGSWSRHSGIFSRSGQEKKSDSARPAKSPVTKEVTTTKPVKGQRNVKRERIKLVIIGDGACGKTSLLIAFSSGAFPAEYVPTVFDNYIADVSIGGSHVELGLWDTAGQEDYDRLRPLSYPHSHVCLICFAIESPGSLANVAEKWVPECRHFLSEVPIIIVGLKSDLRSDPRTIERMGEYSEKPVTLKQGETVAKNVGAAVYLECSALTGKGVREVFRTATTIALGTLLKEKELQGKQTGCVIV